MFDKDQWLTDQRHGTFAAFFNGRMVHVADRIMAERIRLLQTLMHLLQSTLEDGEGELKKEIKSSEIYFCTDVISFAVKLCNTDFVPRTIVQETSQALIRCIDLLEAHYPWSSLNED